MRLSKRTLDLLKNFAAINDNILIKGGTNKLKTISAEGGTILARADVEETFPTDISFYNLNRFLALLDKNNAEVTFEETHAIIETSFGRDTVRYQAPGVLKLPPEDLTKLDALRQVVSFELSKDQLGQFLSRSNIMSLDDVLVTVENKHIVLRAIDKKKPDTSDKSDIILGEYDGSAEFKFYVNRNNLLVLPDSYDVSIAKEGHFRFASKTQDLLYNVAGDAEGTKYSE